MFTKITAKLRTLHPALTSREGAIDLASIMVGVIVIGAIAGAAAATVFAVIPWSQDRAAMQQLDSVRTAQSAAYVQSSSTGPGQYLDGSGLDAAKLLRTAPTVTVETRSAGSCWIATSASTTGTIYWTESTSPTVHTGTKDGPASCGAVAAMTLTLRSEYVEGFGNFLYTEFSNQPQATDRMESVFSGTYNGGPMNWKTSEYGPAQESKNQIGEAAETVTVTLYSSDGTVIVSETHSIK